MVPVPLTKSNHKCKIDMKSNHKIITSLTKLSLVPEDMKSNKSGR